MLPDGVWVTVGVGDCVGLADGDTDGTTVGVGEGAAVGVGAFDGLTVAVGLGVTVGEAEGVGVAMTFVTFTVT